MNPYNPQENETESRHGIIKTGVGLVLTAMGAAGVYWIALRIIDIGNGPQNIPLINKFLAFDASARTLVTPGGNFELPEGLYFTAGFFLYILVLGIAAGLAKSLISTGASLLEFDLASVFKRFKDELASSEDFEK